MKRITWKKSGKLNDDAFSLKSRRNTFNSAYGVVATPVVKKNILLAYVSNFLNDIISNNS